MTLANPIAAAVIGLSLLGERLQGGAAGLLLALAGAAVATWGVVTLSRATPQPSAMESPRTESLTATPVDPSTETSIDEEHPVAAVLALEPGSALNEPSLLPRQPKPGRLTPL